jgi:hypothetical protein
MEGKVLGFTEPQQSEGRILCNGVVSILCLTVTPDVRSSSNLNVRAYSSSTSIWKRQFDKGYEQIIQHMGQ